MYSHWNNNLNNYSKYLNSQYFYQVYDQKFNDIEYNVYRPRNDPVILFSKTGDPQHTYMYVLGIFAF